MKKTIASVLVLLAAASLQAVEVGQVIVRQQWPWSPQVKVEYVLTGVTAPVDISVEVYDGATKLDSPTLSESLSGDVYAVPADGVYALVLDPVKAFGSSRSAIADFRVKLSAAESSSEMTETLYKIVNLESPYDITDISRADLLNGKWGAIERDYRNIIPGSPVTDCLIWTDVTNRPKYKTTHLVFRKIKAAGQSFTVGGVEHERGQWEYSYEMRHTVSFTNDFYMAVFPLTQKQHALISGRTPSTIATGDTLPMEGETWTNMRGYFCGSGGAKKGDWPLDGHELEPNSILDKLRQKVPGLIFDLPTDSMWEVACRAGTLTATYAGNLTAETIDDSDPALDKIAWYASNSDGTPHPVGEKAPNPWGLYDMLGNVKEFVLDMWWTSENFATYVDPFGPLSGGGYPQRLYRAADYSQKAYYHRSAFRGYNSKSIAYSHDDASCKGIGYRLAIFLSE